MSEVCVARQPICDAAQRVVGYELLFRDPLEGIVRDAARATSAVVTGPIAEIGLDTLVGDVPAHLNVSRTFLLEVGPLPLSPDRFVLELPSDSMLDERLLGAVRRLTMQGFTLAVDDALYHPELEPLLGLANLAKIDMSRFDAQELALHAAALRERGLTLVAHRVETREQFAIAQELGFDRFQGFFFARPAMVRARGLKGADTAALRAAARIQACDGSFDELEALIARDVGLSYKLLRFVNSAFFALPRTVATVREAMALLGERMVRRWALMITLAGAGGAPEPLLALALVRGRMCELLGGGLDPAESERLFTVGLFSVIDALLDAPIDEVLRHLPFEPAMLAALGRHEGELGGVLGRVVAFERGDFTGADAAAAAAYREAVAWADAAAGETAVTV